MGRGMVNTCSTQKTGYNLQKTRTDTILPLCNGYPPAPHPTGVQGSGFFVLTWHSAGMRCKSAQVNSERWTQSLKDVAT